VPCAQPVSETAAVSVRPAGLLGTRTLPLRCRTDDDLCLRETCRQVAVRKSGVEPMPIDACTSTFAEMAETILPHDMARLRAALAAPFPMSSFCKDGFGVKAILSELRRSSDFSGCYVLLREGKAFYVGISRTVVQRLRQHVTGKTHYDASLAYQMATEKTGHKMKRADAMQDEAVRTAFSQAKALLRDCSVAFIEIDNPLELYLFEAYCAMELDTCEWNTFRTH